MNHFIFDLLPVFLFFLVFKYYGMYAATWVGIVATFLQTVFYRLRYKRWDKMQMVTLVIFVLFGGMTLYFHDSIFVKWKPTILFWIFAAVLFFSQFIGTKPMAQRMLEAAFEKQKDPHPMVIPLEVGKKLNKAWIIFFTVLGGANLYVAYHFNDNVWVNFKLYGITGTTLLFSLLQTVFLMRQLSRSSHL